MSANQARRPAETETADDYSSVVEEDEVYSGDASHASLSPVLTTELARLYDAGFSLLPLGGDDGKKPIVAFKDRARLPLALVVNRMLSAKSKAFGVRLQRLLVVDVDTDTPEARNYVSRRFGDSPVKTKTGRGFHLYFRHEGKKPATVELPGIRVDFKSGANEFAVGAQSERPDGVVYWPLGQKLVSVSDLPKFEDRDFSSADPQPTKIDGRYPVGCRQKSLKRRAHQLAVVADTFDELLADLLAFREWEIEMPENFSDTYVEGLARWFWHKRENGKLWSGKDSAVLIHRTAIDELASRGEGLAFLLHAILVADHAHKPDEIFAIVPDGLRLSGRLKAGRRQIYDAIDVLVELKLIHCHSKPRGKRNHYLYQLGPVRKEEGRGEGSKVILVPDKDTHVGEGLAA